MNVPLVVSV